MIFHTSPTCLCRRTTTYTRGFTLVELLISMGLLSILLVLLTSIFVSTLQLQLRTEAINFRQQDAQYVLTRLSYDVHRAQSISTPTTVGSQSNSLVLQINGQTWTYSLSGGNLILTNPTGSYQMNNHQTTLTSFTITRVGNSTGKPTVQVDLTVGNRIEGSEGKGDISYSTILGIRS